MAETNSAVKFYRTTSSTFSSATKEDGALYFLTDVGKIYLVVGTGSSQSLYQMSVSPSDIVSNVAQGDGNGQIKVTKNGSASNVSVKGLKSAAYTESTDYATSGHTHDTRYVRFDTNSQELSSTQKSNARTNIGAGTSSFSGSYNDLTNKPTIPPILYRHNIEMVIRSNNIDYYLYFYTINTDSTQITYSEFYGSYGENFMYYPLQGGYRYDGSVGGSDGLAMSWLPVYRASSGEFRGLNILVHAQPIKGWAAAYLSADSYYSWTDTVETL